MRFLDRVGVVTGAAGALGRATASLLASQGAKLLLFDLDEAGLTKTQALCAGSLTFKGDVTSSADFEQARSLLEETFGPADLLAAAAGIAGPSLPLVSVSEEQFDELFAINVKGAWLAAKTFIPGMQAQGRGSVVLFSSTAGLAGSKFLSAYSSSKGAVTLLTKSLALNHAHEGIRVNCVCPGTISSPMVDNSFAALPVEEREGRAALMRAGHPMNRFGKPEEVAHAVGYLLSDDAGFTTGVALPVDGGRMA